MKKEQSKKLQLNVEKVRELTPAQAESAAGGGGTVAGLQIYQLGFDGGVYMAGFASRTPSRGGLTT